MSAQRSVRHLPALDGVRGFAAVSIFICHYGGGKSSSHAFVRLAAELMQFGWAAVSLLDQWNSLGFVWQARLVTEVLLAAFAEDLSFVLLCAVTHLRLHNLV